MQTHCPATVFILLLILWGLRKSRQFYQATLGLFIRKR
jgi:hypothetical protein